MYRLQPLSLNVLRVPAPADYGLMHTTTNGCLQVQAAVVEQEHLHVLFQPLLLRLLEDDPVGPQLLIKANHVLQNSLHIGVVAGAFVHEVAPNGQQDWHEVPANYLLWSWMWSRINAELDTGEWQSITATHAWSRLL